jgi:hypothetical protein
MRSGTDALLSFPSPTFINTGHHQPSLSSNEPTSFDNAAMSSTESSSTAVSTLPDLPMDVNVCLRCTVRTGTLEIRIGTYFLPSLSSSMSSMLMI